MTCDPWPVNECCTVLVDIFLQISVQPNRSNVTIRWTAEKSYVNVQYNRLEYVTRFGDVSVTGYWLWLPSVLGREATDTARAQHNRAAPAQVLERVLGIVFSEKSSQHVRGRREAGRGGAGKAGGGAGPGRAGRRWRDTHK